MKLRLCCLILLAFLIYSCSSNTQQDETKTSEYTYFVTRLGADTLAMERFKIEDQLVTAHVVLRSPQTRLATYQLRLDEAGGIKEMMRFTPANVSFEAIGQTIAQKVQVQGDSLINEVPNRQGEMRRFAMLNQSGALPFIDMVHWPYELALRNAVKSPADSIHQMLLTGRRLSDFIIHKAGIDSLTLRHPSRGVMGVTTNARGHLVKLNAALTTRKLIVTRTNELNFEGLAQQFLDRDAKGSPFGSLSGAVERDFSFKNTQFKVTHGSPSKRGREIFGGIVPWGQRWRTGANRATHFTTSRDLQIGDLTVPAGEYTLFTIPEADGGTLIINKQTGQNGRSYDTSRDLGRVPMTLGRQNEVTEAFTILVEETDSGGVLKLVWDQSVFSVPFSIR